MVDSWININDELPHDDQRVLAFIPENKIFLPGMDLKFEIREVIVLRFCANHFAGNPEKAAKHGLHFWAGEGSSNRYFKEVTHWSPIPARPQE
tara:strand:+ start:1317 stop:1595 length:279 start_codon:yes stop_codon:yes gene_type:complete